MVNDNDYEKRLMYRLLSYHSYLFWSQTFELYPKSPYAKFWLNQDEQGFWDMVKDTCPWCDNFKVFNPTNNGEAAQVGGFPIFQVHCLCESLRILCDANPHPWESMFDPRARLSQILPVNVPEGAAETTKKHVASSVFWIRKPTKWMLLTGGTGTAKSHILFALRRAVGGFGFYITASDLVQSLNDAVESNQVSEMTHALIHAPFLFIDDYGMEHQSKGGYGINMMTHIIDQRYLLRGRAPVVMATNLSLEELIKSPVDNVVRAGSRMMDSDMAQVLVFTQADFRLAATKKEAGLKK